MGCLKTLDVEIRVFEILMLLSCKCLTVLMVNSFIVWVFSMFSVVRELHQEEEESGQPTATLSDFLKSFTEIFCCCNLLF